MEKQIFPRPHASIWWNDKWKEASRWIFERGAPNVSFAARFIRDGFRKIRMANGADDSVRATCDILRHCTKNKQTTSGARRRKRNREKSDPFCHPVSPRHPQRWWFRRFPGRDGIEEASIAFRKHQPLFIEASFHLYSLAIYGGYPYIQNRRLKYEEGKRWVKSRV